MEGPENSCLLVTLESHLTQGLLICKWLRLHWIEVDLNPMTKKKRRYTGLQGRLGDPGAEEEGTVQV